MKNKEKTALFAGWEGTILKLKKVFIGKIGFAFEGLCHDSRDCMVISQKIDFRLIDFQQTGCILLQEEHDAGRRVIQDVHPNNRKENEGGSHHG